MKIVLCVLICARVAQEVFAVCRRFLLFFLFFFLLFYVLKDKLNDLCDQLRTWNFSTREIKKNVVSKKEILCLFIHTY